MGRKRHTPEQIVRADLASHHDRQALPRVLVQHCQQLQRTPVVRPRGHEVVRPDVAPIQRPQPDARSVVEPQPTSLRLPLRDLQPLLPPDPLHPLVVHHPPDRAHRQQPEPARALGQHLRLGSRGRRVSQAGNGDGIRETALPARCPGSGAGSWGLKGGRNVPLARPQYSTLRGLALIRQTNSSPDAWNPVPSESLYPYIEEAALSGVNNEQRGDVPRVPATC